MSRGLEYRGDIMQIGKLYDIDEVRQLGGIIDYVVGTPLTKVYVLAEHPDPKQQMYLNLYKMGEGPLYPFFVPYHIVHFEVPSSIARVVLFGDSIAPPLAGPVVEVCAVAKRDLKAGEYEFAAAITPWSIDAQNTAAQRQVSGTSDCATRRDQLLFIELIEGLCVSQCPLNFHCAAHETMARCPPTSHRSPSVPTKTPNLCAS